MIQKRYQYYSREGIKWTDWFNFESDDSRYEELKSKELFQFNKKLKNEYRKL